MSDGSDHKRNTFPDIHCSSENKQTSAENSDLDAVWTQFDPQRGDKHIESSKLSQRDRRSIVFHLLYVADSHEYEVSLAAIVDTFYRGFGLTIQADDSIITTTQAIIDEREKLDVIYIPFLENWRFERISVPTKLILRFAVWELCHSETPAIIIINEAVELAKCFAEEDAFRFINGILDRVAQSLGKKVDTNAPSEPSTP